MNPSTVILLFFCLGCGVDAFARSSALRLRSTSLSLKRMAPLNASPAVITTASKSLIGNSNPWAVWSALSAISTFGLASERTKIGQTLGSPLVTMLTAMILCNVGIIPAATSQYQTVMKYFVAFAIPSLLLDADLKRCINSTGTLLKAFLVGACGSVVGSIVAFALVPMRDVVGSESHKIAAAICSRHIGGAVNFVCIANILKIQPDLQIACIAADNAVVALYFCFLSAIVAPDKDETMSEFVRRKNMREVGDSSGMVAEQNQGSQVTEFAGMKDTKEVEGGDDSVSEQNQGSPGAKEGVCPLDAIFGTNFSNTGKDGAKEESTSGLSAAPIKTTTRVRTALSADSRVPITSRFENSVSFSVLNVSAAVTVSLLICALSHTIGSFYDVSGMLFTSILACILGTLFPKPMSRIAKPGGVLGVFLMQYFFAVIGAQAYLPYVFRLAPSVFGHAFVQIAVHFLFMCVVGRNLLNIPFREIALASNANVGGPTTAAAMAQNKKWKSLVLPALLTGVFGYSIATTIGLFVHSVLRNLM